MMLKIRNLNWLAGRPVVIIGNKLATAMNIFVNDRVTISSESKKVCAVVDIFHKIVKEKEIGLSHELSKVLNLKNGSLVEVTSSEVSAASFLIKKKINKEELSRKELNLLISEIVHNGVTEAEIAFFESAIKLNGMDIEETVNLTKAMVNTGATLKFSGKCIADKHCIGGIAGNRTTPLVVSICAAVGITMPKTSSRAITSASGTADVIETISNVELSIKKINEVVKKTGACMAWGGSLGLAPSDDKIIKVERLLNLDIEPQLVASIMSKKISAGAKNILIDIPYGPGSKMTTLKKAKQLGKKFMSVGKKFKLKLKVIYTDGKQPIGNGIGPTLEMLDVLKVLTNFPDQPLDLREKSLLLSEEIIKLCGIKNAKQKAIDALESGKAYEKFKEIINGQNGKKDFDDRVDKLKLAKFKKVIKSKKSGKISKISNSGINSICRILGTPETVSAGAYLHKHIGEIKKGEPLITLYTESKSKMKDALKFIKEFKPITIKKQ
jgi:putative thymidine phosphorylase